MESRMNGRRRKSRKPTASMSAHADPSYPLSNSLNCRCQPRQTSSLRLPEKIALLFPLLTNNFLAIRVERIIHGQFSFKQLMIIAIDKPETLGNRLEAG
jgi:hypothetical protein